MSERYNPFPGPVMFLHERRCIFIPTYFEKNACHQNGIPSVYNLLEDQSLLPC